MSAKPEGQGPAISSRAAVVLAGGRGARLGPGPPKALRPLAGRTLLERALATARALADEVWVSVPPGFELPPLEARIVRDHAAFGPRAGPLVALASALDAIERPWAFVLAADFPFARREVFEGLWELRGEPPTAAPGAPAGGTALGVVPWTAIGPQPLLALYRREAAPALLALAQAGERMATRALLGLPLVRVPTQRLRGADPDLASFRNLNTPEAWARAEAELADGRGRSEGKEAY